MADLETWTKLAAYVVSIGIGLELAHRVYWQFNRSAVRLEASVATKTVLSSALACIPLGAALAITAAFCRFFDASSIASLGLGWRPDALQQLSAGIVVGGIGVTAIFLAGCSMGWFRVSKSPFEDSQGSSVPHFCGAMTDFFIAAVFEELTVRGYIFTLLNDAGGLGLAVYGSAVVFAAFHLLRHPRIPLIFTLNAFAFGVLAAQARAVTGSLWLPIGLHFGWNLAMGPVFGLPCGGRVYDKGLVTCSVDGPSWVTGGDFSPDAGILGTVALIITAAGLLVLAPAA